jgi:hypothetical protein
MITDWVAREYPEPPSCSVAMMANDTDWRHQLLVSRLHPKSLWLFEDGVGSYVDRSPSNRTSRAIYRTAVYKPFFGKSYWNSRGLGRSPASRYFSLFAGAFPFVSDRSKTEVLDVSSSPYVHSLKRLQLGFEPEGPTAVITTQPLVETGVVRSIEEEIPMWRSLGRYAGERVEYILLKPHPGESPDTAERRADAVRSGAHPAAVTLAPASLPAEVLYLALDRIDLVLGSFSTGLATAVLLLPGAKVVAPLHGPFSGTRRGGKYHSAYRSVLSRIGVEFLDFSALESTAGTRG